MIQKAVFSYFNPDESFDNTSGFLRFSDFLFTTALAINCASRHFKEVQFISSDWGIDVVSQLKLPITSYSNRLNEMKEVSPFFWAYGKLLAHCEQKKPFVHIDNDVFMWYPLPGRILKASLCFQAKEPFDDEGYQYYSMLRKCWQRAKVRPRDIVDNPVDDFAYNCGICGGNYLPIFEEWRRNSAEYIFAPENQNLFFEEEADMLIHQNLFHEQYFLACLVKKYNLRKKVSVLNDDALAINDPYPAEEPIYTHLWGTMKKDGAIMSKVRMSLFSQNRALFMRVYNFCRKNQLPQNYGCYATKQLI